MTPEHLMRKTRVYLDNCCFNRPYDDLDNINAQQAGKKTKNQERKRNRKKFVREGNSEFLPLK